MRAVSETSDRQVSLSPEQPAPEARRGSDVRAEPDEARTLASLLSDKWPWLLIVLVVAVGFTQLDSYSVTWDEALGDLFFGERYLSYFTSFDSKYLDFEANPYPADRRPDLGLSPFRNRPWEYYPFTNVLGAASAAVLSRTLGWLDYFDAFHAVNLFLTVCLILTTWVVVGQRLGTWVAGVSLLVLLSSPRVVVHMLANTKDFPELVFFSTALFVFFWAWERGSVPGLVGAGVLTGVALATKANALFLAPVFALVVLLGGRPAPWASWYRVASAGAGAALGAVLFLYASWPYLWPAPVSRFSEHLSYIAGQVNQVREESVLSPAFAILGTVPVPVLVLCGLGLIPMSRGLVRRDRWWILVAAWIGVVVGRLYLPGAVNFDGVRHFLELMPALAIVAAAGCAWSVAWISDRLGQIEGVRPGLMRVMPAVGILVAVLPGLGATIGIHPHQIAYWNGLVGGTSGAFARGVPQAGDYWGLSYRQGLAWLNENAPSPSFLAVPIVEHAVRVVASERLRDDIELLRVSVPFFPDIPPQVIAQLPELANERPLFVMFVNREDWSNDLVRQARETGRRVHQIELDRVPLLEIYQWPAGGAASASEVTPALGVGR